MGPEDFELGEIERGERDESVGANLPHSASPPHPPVEDGGGSDHLRAAEKILGKLKAHILLSLVDMLLYFGIIALPSPADKILVYLYLELCFWVPIAVIRSNLSPHLDGVLTYLFRLSCHNEVGIFQGG